jgi:DNA-directed RNA polymerase specialized sigma24 family protein
MAFGEQFHSVLQAAQADAGWAYERLYRWLSPSVCGYLRMQGAYDPEDLTSEVFLGAFRAIGSFSGGEDGFRAWVFTFAHRRLTDDRRARGCRPSGSGRCARGWPPTRATSCSCAWCPA